MRNKTPTLTVEIPAPDADRPSWGRVGIVAAVGFAVGIAWPRLTGTRIAPSPPVDSPASAAATASSGDAVSPSPSSAANALANGAAGALAAPGGAGAANSQPGATAPTPLANLSVGRGSILRCSDGKDEMRDECGALQFDPVAVPRLKELAQCPGAAGLSGKLSIGFEIDFKHKGLHVQRGKSTTLPAEPSEALMKCLRNSFANVTLDDVPHEHRRYTIFYSANFTAPGKPPDAAPEAPAAESSAGATTNEAPASGNATVAWEVAILRDSPKAGNVVGRVLRGTKVKVLGHQNEWYRVEFGPGGHEGWVYRGAIGL